MMKKAFKKNQVVIAALTVLLGVAGYINFSGNDVNLGKKSKDNGKEATEEVFAENGQEDIVVDVAEGELTLYDVEGEENIELNSDEEDIGEAVFTSADVSGSLVNIKLNREQARSKSKEYYLEIINSDSMEEAVVQEATSAYVKLTEDMEKEADAETLLMAKGFDNAIVSISDNSVDVVVSNTELTDIERAQIEDIVVRKTGCSVDQIVITSMAK
ncbi:MAG: SpoIIIAH-like family protein [Lachnospiraceae bacterium]|nr:SpoIIIAH-like family protein [Lachnospiraceae bacterium]